MMIVAGFDLGEVESESPRLRSGCGGCCTPGTTAAAPDPTTNGSDNHRNGKDQTGSQKFSNLILNHKGLLTALLLAF